MPELTVHHILGFLDGRISSLKQEFPFGREAWLVQNAKIEAYEDLKSYILIEGAIPDPL